jgi:hypothetical protein
VAALPTSRSIINPARLGLCRLAGAEAAAVRFSASAAAAQMVQAGVTVPDNGGLALTFALVERKISPKAGIIKSLEISQ